MNIQNISTARQATPAIRRYLRHCFPKESWQNIEDASQEALLALLEKSDDDRIWEAEELIGLLKCIAWRKLRACGRRSSRRLEQNCSRWEGLRHGVPPGQDWAVIASEIGRWVDEAAVRYRRRDPERLRRALWRVIRTGESDTQLALELGIPRETLNRAKRFVIHQLFGR